MNIYLISIGTNFNPETGISIARKLLEEHFSHITFSSTTSGPSFDTKYTIPFLNTLALIYSTESLDQVQHITKEIEYLMGRTTEDKLHGIVKIDIDIIKQNESILRPQDYSRDYIQRLLPELRENTHLPNL